MATLSTSPSLRMMSKGWLAGAGGDAVAGLGGDAGGDGDLGVVDVGDGAGVAVLGGVGVVGRAGEGDRVVDVVPGGDRVEHRGVGEERVLAVDGVELVGDDGDVGLDAVGEALADHAVVGVLVGEVVGGEVRAWRSWSGRR
jgi:hypothetical protein